MAGHEGTVDIADCDWRYTREKLEEMYDSSVKGIEAGTSTKDEAYLAAAVGYALDLMNFARNMPNQPKELDLIGPTSPEDMALVIGAAAIAFLDEGQDAVRTKLARMLASYEFFTTMNTLDICGIEFEYQVNELEMLVRAVDAEGEHSEFNFLARAKFAMSRSILSEEGEDPYAGIYLGPLYNKLNQNFVAPLLKPYV